jgi:hypothetical protein
MSVARTVPTPRFDCVVYLLHVLDRIEDAIKPLQDCINKQNDKITSLKAENEQMKGKLNKRIEQSWYHSLYDFRFQHSCFYKLTHIKRLALRFEGYLFVTSRIWDLSSH